MTKRAIPPAAKGPANAKETTNAYYFEDMNACPCPELFVSGHPWEAVMKTGKIKSGTNIEVKLDPTVKVSGDVSIGKGTVIDPYVVIEGPARIGKDCTIRAFALIRPGTILGNKVVVGHATEVKNAIAFDGVKMASHTFVGDSVLGKGARIASGTIIGNRRFDQQEVEIRIKDEVFATGRDKFGIIVGDFARIGACCSTAPGTLVGPYTWTYANLSLRGFYPAESLVKLRQETQVVKKGRQELKSVDRGGHI
jgi:UDP-N-acetylglucosamine diphosphorylase / glucose-1-phosphate thymidylyltransferase / UDP-N-acetylgalactosamine diphosphorylase / glucosamine-1-phosphate N-acetyltransferase / galactosamine-1-phosphate N-acetyltransferase